jgi:peptide deformylase
LPLVLYPDDRLGQAAEPRPVDAGLLAIGAALLEAAQSVQAYGLAAVHMGEVAPVIVMSAAPDANRRDYLLLYNPEVMAVADKSVVGPEGSVSMPDVQVEIMRPIWAEIAFDDAAGVRQTRRFEGLPARIALHEIEQMNGIFFLSRLSRLKRDMVLKKYRKRAG